MNDGAMTLTIGFKCVILVINLTAAAALTKWEMKHNKYKPFQIAQRYLLHFLFTELTALKIVLGCAGWVLGKGYPSSLYPIKRSHNYSCRVCKDTGRIKNGWADRGRECSCKVSKAWMKKLGEN